MANSKELVTGVAAAGALALAFSIYRSSRSQCCSHSCCNPKATSTGLAQKNTLKLYVYEICPFCVRARTILGFKKVRHQLIYLDFDNEETPISLVGAKQVPIIEAPDGTVMAESLDIVRYVDKVYGETTILAESANRKDLDEWNKKYNPLWIQLLYARAINIAVPELAKKAARANFREKKEKSVGSFEKLREDSPNLITKANAALTELVQLFKYSDDYINESLSYDDITLFSTLRNLTLVKGIKFPPKIRNYIEKMSERADVPLLDSLAC